MNLFLLIPTYTGGGKNQPCLSKRSHRQLKQQDSLAYRWIRPCRCKLILIYTKYHLSALDKTKVDLCRHLELLYVARSMNAMSEVINEYLASLRSIDWAYGTLKANRLTTMQYDHPSDLLFRSYTIKYMWWLLAWISCLGTVVSRVQLLLRRSNCVPHVEYTSLV